MAYFINTNINRGLLRNNLNVELRNKQSLMVPELLRGFQIDFKGGDEVNIKGKKINIVELEENEIRSKNKINEKKFWMTLIDPSSKKEIDIVDRMKKSLTVIETAKAIISALMILVSQFEYELLYYDTFYVDKNPDAYEGLPVRILYSIATFFLILLNYMGCYKSFLLKKEQKRIADKYFCCSYYFNYFLFEALIDIIHPFPKVEYQFDIIILGQKITYSIQTFFYAFQFLKVYHILMLIGVFTVYTDIVSEKYCEFHGGESDTVFSLKSVQKDRPFLLLSVCMLTVIIVLGVVLRMFEILNIVGAGDKDYYFYTNGIWNIAVAITTVGYGDIYPRTHLGRTIVVFAIFLGTFIVSLSIVALQKAASFNKLELQAFSILKRILARKNLNEVLYKIIQINVRLFFLKKRFKDQGELTKIPAYMSLYKKRKELSTTKLEILREMNKDNFTSQEDKFLDLEPRIDSEVFSIKENLKQIGHFKNRFELQLEEQRKLIKKLDNTLELTTKTTKRLFYKIFAKEASNNKKILNDSTLLPSSLKDNTFKNIFTKDVSSVINKKGETEQSKDNSKKALYEENSSSNLIIDENEITQEDFAWEDLKSTEVVKSKSMKTFDLLQSLQKIKDKNKILSHKMKEEKLKKVKEFSLVNSNGNALNLLESPFGNTLSPIKSAKKKKNTGTGSKVRVIDKLLKRDMSRKVSEFNLQLSKKNDIDNQENSINDKDEN